VVRSTTDTGVSAAPADGGASAAVNAARGPPGYWRIIDDVEIIEIVRRRVAALLPLVVHQRHPALVVGVAYEDIVVERRLNLHLVDDLGAGVDDVDDAGPVRRTS
jgi:hypothetical protein